MIWMILFFIFAGLFFFIASYVSITGIKDVRDLLNL